MAGQADHRLQGLEGIPEEVGAPAEPILIGDPSGGHAAAVGEEGPGPPPEPEGSPRTRPGARRRRLAEAGEGQQSHARIDFPAEPGTADQHQGRHAAQVGQGEAEGGEAPERVAGDDGAGDVQRIQEPGHELGGQGRGIGGARPVAPAEAREVRGDHAGPVCQGRQDPLPIPGAVAEAVVQDQVRAVPRGEVMDP